MTHKRKERSEGLLKICGRLLMFTPRQIKNQEKIKDNKNIKEKIRKEDKNREI